MKIRFILVSIWLCCLSCDSRLDYQNMVVAQGLMLDCGLTQWSKDEPTDCQSDAQLSKVMGYLDGEWARLILHDHTEPEDSVFIVKRSGFLTVEVLYLDIAQRHRNLKTWDYVGANDRREKINEKLYRRTLGFD